MSLSNNMSKLIYDIKGKNLEGVTMNFKDMADKDIEALMNTERFSLTCAPGGENNMGMEIIGRMPIKGEGFTAQDIEELAPYFRKLMNGDMKENMEKVSMLNLNKISLIIFILIFIHMIYFQLKKLEIENSKSCLVIFKSNNFLGLIVLIGLIIGKI